jgi:hypothetical protein
MPDFRRVSIPRGDEALPSGILPSVRTAHRYGRQPDPDVLRCRPFVYSAEAGTSTASDSVTRDGVVQPQPLATDRPSERRSNNQPSERRTT